MLRYFSKRFFNFRIKSKKKCLILINIVFIMSYLIILSKKSDNYVEKRLVPYLDVICMKHNITLNSILENPHIISENGVNCLKQHGDKHVLLILTSDIKNNHLQILLQSIKLKFDSVLLKNIEKVDWKINYSLIVIENLILFYNLNSTIIAPVTNYCFKNNVYIISGVVATDFQSRFIQIGNLPLYLISGYKLINLYTTNSSLLYFTKSSKLVSEIFEGKKWSFVFPVKTGFEALAFSEDKSVYINDIYLQYSFVLNSAKYKPIVIKDFGNHDGIKKIIFSTDLTHWMNILIFMDALRYSCNLDLNLNLQRYVHIDIDDIFVGKSGSRMVKSDVIDLVTHQRKWQSHLKNFKFNLGFSGYYFKSGSENENEADEFLIENKHLFNWFPHMWSHKKPHLMNEDKLYDEILNNVKFANKLQLNTSSNYGIAPFHSGIYPTYDIFYDLWKKSWNISVTSTEEYPKLNPSRFRKGFIYRNISVLPRQTCGIYTHTIYLDKYPKGKSFLNKSILGGSLFLTLLYNKVNIFMTHFSNYGSDRLGLYVFDSLFRFIKCYTNLELIQKSPVEVSELYFTMLPNEKEPIWYNPCLYKRHKFLLPITYSCSRLPKFVIVGPQKSASTALYKFLNLHPEISSNILLPDTFEEPQFFSSNKYGKGVEWYMSLFRPKINETVYFEKSASYFDNALAPKLMHDLLPRIKLVILLKNPIDRAYSWYQHVLAHNDETALKFTFHDVITSENSKDIGLNKLRNRCLVPGMYFNHLQHWINFYLPNNIILLDSDKLTQNPISVMNGLQELLPVKSRIDYSNYLKFSTKKGFFCSKNKENKSKLDCLGPGKGRHYLPMRNDTYNYLYRYYLESNQNLIKLLQYYRYNSLPQWLQGIHL